MDPKLQALLAVVPERTARGPSGTPFAAASLAARHPERLAHLATRLSWLTPLEPPGFDDQRILGLVNAAGRPVQVDLEDGGETEADGAPPPESARYAAA